LEALYGAIQEPLKERGMHFSVEAAFSTPLRLVSAAEFAEDVLRAANHGHDHDTHPTSWGSLAVRRLPYFDRLLRRTRLYSPDFNRQVFGWNVLENEGDACYVKSSLRLK
jgi:hypothetical protein